MTREEAIKKLQKQKAEYLDEWVDFSGVAEAYDMAIKALEQEPCEDAVSRKQAISAIRNLYPGTPFVRLNLKKWQEENKKYFECENIIKALPSVTPAPKKCHNENRDYDDCDQNEIHKERQHHDRSRGFFSFEEKI